ncbi:STAS domain-containing protein [Chlorogloeopsis sp. ULAP02]|uniref:STAS domain-containing protein n=1 Tax=Chlorogloeopsis sp. ULAP02 TaxID=3107926 RepID=UPI00313675D8
MTVQVRIVKPSGILDSTKSQEFREKIAETLESGAKVVLVNLEDVTFMDSSGLGALVLAFKTLRAVESKLVVCSMNEQVRILFELTGMDKVFEIFTNQDEFKSAEVFKSE